MRAMTRTEDWRGIALRVALLLALVLAPLLVQTTHGPGQIALAIAATADIAEHGHSHDDGSGDAFGDHDAADHEHQSQAVLSSQQDKADRQPRSTWRIEHLRAGSAARDGPERPPRWLTA
jgi:hypothetical protein